MFVFRCRYSCQPFDFDPEPLHTHISTRFKRWQKNFFFSRLLLLVSMVSRSMILSRFWSLKFWFAFAHFLFCFFFIHWLKSVFFINGIIHERNLFSIPKFPPNIRDFIVLFFGFINMIVQFDNNRTITIWVAKKLV